MACLSVWAVRQAVGGRAAVVAATVGGAEQSRRRRCRRVRGRALAYRGQERARREGGARGWRRGGAGSAAAADVKLAAVNIRLAGWAPRNKTTN